MFDILGRLKASGPRRPSHRGAYVVKSADGFTGPDKGHHSDDERRVRRAQIPVHCGGCGATFPGDTKLTNGLCHECCRSPIHLIRKVERLKRENAILRAAVRLAAGLLDDAPRAEINALLDRAEDDDE